MIRIALSLLLCVAPALSAAQQIQSPDSRAALDSLNVRAAPHIIASFPGALASSTVALASLGNLAPFLAGTGLTLTARPFDHEVQGALADRVEGVGDLGDAIGHGLVVTGGTLGLFAAGQIAPAGRFRRVTFDLAQGLVINGALTGIFKRSFGRQRPDSTNSRSFPSGHTSTAFTWATVLTRHFGPEVGIPATLVATYIAVSRVEDNEHFFSDIVAGGVLGYVVGRTVSRFASESGGGEGRLSITPFAGRRHGGVHLQLTF